MPEYAQLTVLLLFVLNRLKQVVYAVILVILGDYLVGLVYKENEVLDIIDKSCFIKKTMNEIL